METESETQLTSDAHETLYPAWTDNGNEIVFSSTRGGNRGLWRMPAAGGPPVPISGAGEDVFYVSAAHQTRRLTWGRYLLDANLWRVPTAGEQSGSGDVSSPFALSSRNERSPRYSPDGRFVTFQSDRSGSIEIWVADSDGSRARQLTNFGHGHSGTPRWSPESQNVVFDADVEGNFNIYVVARDGGTPRRLTDHPAQDASPSCSTDGRFVYFTSHRSGRAEIWKVPFEGGPAVQVTSTGRRDAMQSPDGNWLYYVKAFSPSALMRTRVDGTGREEEVIPSVASRNFFVTRGGVYYMKQDSPGQVSLRYLDLESRKERVLSTTMKIRLWVSLSRSMSAGCCTRAMTRRPWTSCCSTTCRCVRDVAGFNIPERAMWVPCSLAPSDRREQHWLARPRKHRVRRARMARISRRMGQSHDAPPQARRRGLNRAKYNGMFGVNASAIHRFRRITRASVEWFTCGALWSIQAAARSSSSAFRPEVPVVRPRPQL